MHATTFEAKDWEEVEPGYWTAEVTIFGVPHYLEAIRVSEDRQGYQTAWEPPDGDNANPERLDRLIAYAYNPTGWATVKLPWTDGDFIIVITPYGA